MPGGEVLQLGTWEAFYCNFLAPGTLAKRNLDRLVHRYLKWACQGGARREWLVIVEAESCRLAISEWVNRTHPPGPWPAFTSMVSAMVDFARTAKRRGRAGKSAGRVLVSFDWDASVAKGTAGRDDGGDRFSAIVVNDYGATTHLGVLHRLLARAAKVNGEAGGMVLHSSAISWQGRAVLCLGESGAGKSTVAQYAHAAGWQVLGDDLNVLSHRPLGGYQISGCPGTKPRGFDPSGPACSVDAILVLVKDKSDFLVPMTEFERARALLAAVLQVPCNRSLIPGHMERVFRSLCQAARTLPGFALHFRRSPRFLDVIPIPMVEGT